MTPEKTTTPEEREAEAVFTILKLIEGNKTTFVKTEKPAGPVIDTHALKKLLMNKPLCMELPVQLIRIRCDRNVNQWGVFDAKGKKAVSHFTCGVLKDATLSSKELPAMGCGDADYVGMASGDMVSQDAPISVPSDQVHRLHFDRHDGCFVDARTGETITRVDYLILKEGCHAEYISA